MKTNLKNCSLRIVHGIAYASLPKFKCEGVINGNKIRLLAVITCAVPNAFDNEDHLPFVLTVFSSSEDGVTPIAYKFMSSTSIEEVTSILDTAVVSKGWEKYVDETPLQPSESILYDDGSSKIVFFKGIVV